MNISVHSKTISVTGAIREFTARSARKIRRLSQPVQEVRVFLENINTKKGLSQEAMVKIELSVPGKNIIASSKAKDMYAAITLAFEDAARSLRKRKEKLIDQSRTQIAVG